MTERGARRAVATSHQLATHEALAVLDRGGTAVDAAVVAGAVLSVAMPHAGGVGGDLMAVVARDGVIAALDASGHAGSGIAAQQLRSEGHTSIAPTGDVHAVTVPGCVDGWLALHERFGHLPLDRLLQPAVHYASKGLAAASGLVSSLHAVLALKRSPKPAGTPLPGPGDDIRWPGLARTLEAVSTEGRAGFYGGEFGERLLALGQGLFKEADLQQPQAEWVEPAVARIWGHELWSLPPNSPAHVMLTAAAVSERVGMPDPLVSGWPHTLIEAMRLAAAGRDCATVGGGRGNWAATPDRVLALTRRISPSRISTVAGPGCRAGGTVAVVVGERDGGFVALLQSNGIGFGSGLSIPGLGIWLHNRGSAFSLEADHPAEYGPGRRPLHTLAPALVTRDGIPVTALASTGGDAQIQAGLQILVRLLAHRHPPAAAVGAARWAVDLPTAVPTAESFVYLEGHAPPAWSRGLDRRGHRVTTVTPLHPAFGRAQLVVDDGESLQAVSDSRSSEGGGAQR